MNANNELIKKALRNSRAFIEGMMNVGGIPVTLCKLAADIHTQIQEAEKDINSSLESKATANEGKVREDVIKKAYIAGVEDCNEDQIRASHGKDNYELEELYANFKTANQSLFTEEDKVIRCPKCGSLNFYESFKKNRLFHKAEEDKGVDWDALESKWHDLTLKEEHLGIENYENVFEFLKNQPEFQKKGAEK